MDVPSFLQSKQLPSTDSGLKNFFKDRKKIIITLVILLFAIPLTVWLLQRSQIFAPKAGGGAISLVAGNGSCVLEAGENKASCGHFPITLTSPFGPPVNSSQSAVLKKNNFADKFNFGLISLARAQDAMPQASLVSWWKMDETGKTAVVADSKGINNGTATGTTITEGKSGQARYFSSAGDIIDVGSGSSLSNANNMTISAWVSPSAGGTKYIVFHPGASGGAEGAGRWELMTDGSNRPRFDVFNGEWKNCSGSTALPLNTWSMVTGTYDRTNLKVYVNGELAGSCPQNTIVDLTGGNTYIGYDNNNGSENWKGSIDEVVFWSRALNSFEVKSVYELTSSPAASPSPSAAASSSPVASGSPISSGSPAASSDVSPTPAQSASPDSSATSSPSTDLPGTISYRVAENESGLALKPLLPYTSYPMVVDFAFSDQTPGVRQIWAEFISSTGESRVEHISVTIVEPAPVINSLSCSMDLAKQNLRLRLDGARLGSGSGKVSVDGKEAQVESWTENQVLASINPGGNIEGKLFKVVLAMKDGKLLPEVSCQVDTTLVSLGARLFCREPGKFDVNGVEVIVIDEDGNKVNETVTIDKDGIIKNLKTRLQVGKRYAISFKVPYSLRKNALFTAANGTNIVNTADGTPFVLPVGDIAPVVLPDGKINTLDRSELVRQWSVLASSAKTGDFNKDSRVNSIDWACMRFDFNKEDESIPVNAMPPSPVPSASLIPGASQGTLSPAPSSSLLPSPVPSLSPEPSAGPSVAYFLLEPSETGSYINDDEFFVDVNIWSQSEAANLFSAKMGFDPNALEVVRIEKGSALTSWVESYFDNQTGQIALTAGLPSPGLITTEGSNPRMARIVFRAKAVGLTAIALTGDSKIYSNSTNQNILTTLMEAQIIVTNQ